MGKFVCRCGCVMDTTSSPEPALWIAIRDADREWLARAEVESERLSQEPEGNQELVRELDDLTSGMYALIQRCPACHRLFWFQGEDGRYDVFALEARSIQ